MGSLTNLKWTLRKSSLLFRVRDLLGLSVLLFCLVALFEAGDEIEEKAHKRSSGEFRHENSQGLGLSCCPKNLGVEAAADSMVPYQSQQLHHSTVGLQDAFIVAFEQSNVVTSCVFQNSCAYLLSTQVCFAFGASFPAVLLAKVVGDDRGDFVVV